VSGPPAPAIGGYGEWAWRYREQGWVSVLPLPYRKKTPPPADYTGQVVKKTGLAPHIPDDPQIAAWVELNPRGNLCLRMPGDVIGIDVDDYEYQYQARDPETKEPITRADGSPLMLTGVKTGGAVLAAMEARFGKLPPTWRSSSRGDGPSGIRFYRVPLGLTWGDFGTHLEGIWWGHRYAAVWPSINPDSEARYLWLDENDPDAGWGPWIPKVTELPELPSRWITGLSKNPAGTNSAPDTPGVPSRQSRVPDVRDGQRRFTRAQAAQYVETEGLEPLRAAPHGTINNRINDAATVMSHFVPAFWNPAAAHALLWDAARTAGYDDLRSATKSIDSGLGVISWVAELVDEPAPRARDRTTMALREPGDVDEPPEPDPDTLRQEEDFWSARITLGHIYDYARACYTAPWAVFGAVLARAVASVEPNIQLPATIGSETSLNLFIALVGRSGGGKDIAYGVAKKALDIWRGQELLETDTIPLGSGEGLSHVYMKYPPKLTKRKGAPDEDSQAIGLGATADPDKPIQYRTRALITIKEVDTLEAIGQRRGSTLAGQLRQAWMADQLGFQYVDVMKRMIVPEHSYRMCIVAGIQPGRAASLMAEADGGTPQRFLWLPASDPTMTMDAPPLPDPMGWDVPFYSAGRVLFDLCDTAAHVVKSEHIKRQREDGDALDGHSVLGRVKVAAALALLDVGRPPRDRLTVTDEDWELAGVVQAVSDRTRAGIVRHLAEASRQANTNQAIAEAHKTITISETVERDGLQKAVASLRRRIGDDWVTHGELREKMTSTARKHLAEALDRMEAAGEIESGTHTSGRQTGRQVRRRAGHGG